MSAPTPRLPREHLPLEQDILHKLVYTLGREPERALPRDWWLALSLAVRDRTIDSWMTSKRRIRESDQKCVYYLSMEFLIGRLLRDCMTNLGITEACTEALNRLGQDMDVVLAAEPDPALGNGGLGRLAACFLDSMSTLGIVGFGYGILYRHGLFRQTFESGWQKENPESWLTPDYPFAVERFDLCYPVDFSHKRILASAHDIPIAGWQGHHVNTLRLWAAHAVEPFDLARFNAGGFIDASAAEVAAESVARVLYPNDDTMEGRLLRLKQEFFFTSASLQDVLRRYREHHHDLEKLPDHIAIQLNDTHPAIAVPELIRLLTDLHGLEFGSAFEVTRRCLGYTNHTLLPEALERWPIDTMRAHLPRQLEIIERIHDRVEAEARHVGIDPYHVGVLGDGAVRMGHLAFAGSQKVNGVSALHTELMKQTVFKDLHKLYPDRILNQTNGITPRRWLLETNPALARLATNVVGEGWITNLERLDGLLPMAEDSGFQAAFAGIKHVNKIKLATEIEARTGIRVDPAALFDVQIKRIHEYKRQLLNILEAIAEYLAIRHTPDLDRVRRVRIFGGKAAPGYERAKLIIKLINDVAEVVNNDPLVGDRLKIVFLPNYNVSLAEIIIPAADLSEQISTAGMEASGTGNMKFALNGALTIGTLDGANVEIRDQVGEDNIFIFGLTADQVSAWRASGYNPSAVIAATPVLEEVLGSIERGLFSPDDPHRFRAITDDLRHRDYFMLAADFAAYAHAQREVDRVFANPHDWRRRAIRNCAKMGWFSSDRTIRGYASDIWRTRPMIAG